MDEEIRRKLETLEAKIDATYRSAEKTRKYFLGVIVVSVVALVLPLIGLMFALPSFLGSYSELMTGL